MTSPVEATPGVDLLHPPHVFFDDPQLKMFTPLTVTRQGRVMGHLAAWSQSHVGFPGQNVRPPRSKTGYMYFHQGTTDTDTGHMVRVGKITLGTGHAGAGAGIQAAAEHYDNTGTAVAVVRAGEDKHGVWVAGALVPGVDALRIAELRRSPLSGDWRRVNGNLELVAALAVNSPGFPIAYTDKAGVTASLTASGWGAPAVVSRAQLKDLLPHLIAGAAAQVLCEFDVKEWAACAADVLKL